MSAFKCEVCGKLYNYRKTLNRHISTDHPEYWNSMKLPFQKKESSNSHVCYLCDKSFTCKYSLKRHLHDVHEQLHDGGFKCVMCSVEFLTKKNWVNHFQTVHEIEMKSEEVQFSSEQEFLNWKEEIEYSTCSKFNRSGFRVAGDISTTYYSCHRSGNFISTNEGKRHEKITGSRKIGGKCPAEMKVSLSSEGRCSVYFSSTHVGHDSELKHLPLSRQDRDAIAADIALGIPFPTVLEKIRASVQESKLERKHITTMQDLHNIATSYNLSSKSVRHKNDAISVHAWVQEVNESVNPCVLLYKPQDTVNENHPELKSEDFMLVIMNRPQREMLSKYGSEYICVDGTHGLNGYDFEVTTLLVLDDLRQGFPCAFMISNRNDCDVLNIFFNCVKSQVGLICPRVFMSDLAESYYTAWNKTMGPPGMRLYCTWHVDKAWKNNLYKKVRNGDKRIEVYKLIRSLMQLTNVEVFEESFQKALQKLHSDPETADFGSYMKTYYGKNAKCWAYCHRMHAGLNTNMHLESMHRTMKHVHAKAKQVKRLDKGISAIMSHVTAKMFDTLIACVKGKVVGKVRDIRQRHKSSYLLNQDQITKVGRGWEVPASQSDEIYYVQENKEQCRCNLLCTDCKVCIHRYSCTCLDYSIKLNMCKHIHSVCQIMNMTQTELQNNEISDALPTDEDISVREAILEEVSASPSLSRSLAHEKQTVIKMFQEIVGDMDTKEVQLAKKMLLSLKASVGAIRATGGSFINKSGNSLKRNLEPQRRLFSTKKKKTVRNTPLAVPAARESQEIIRDLLAEGLDNVNVVHDDAVMPSQIVQQPNVTRFDVLPRVAVEHSYAMSRHKEEQQNTTGNIGLQIKVSLWRMLWLWQPHMALNTPGINTSEIGTTVVSHGPRLCLGEPTVMPCEPGLNSMTQDMTPCKSGLSHNVQGVIPCEPGFKHNTQSVIMCEPSVHLFTPGVKLQDPSRSLGAPGFTAY